MDRFIVEQACEMYIESKFLKSNMDRFIGRQTRTQERIFWAFKIQYG